MAVIVLFPKTLVLFESFVTNQPFFLKKWRGGWFMGGVAGVRDNKELYDAACAIMSGMTWEDTVQGQKYWADVHDALMNMYEAGKVCEHAFKCVKCGEVVEE